MNAEEFATIILVAGGLLGMFKEAIWACVCAYKKRKDYESRFGQDMPERGGERNG